MYGIKSPFPAAAALGTQITVDSLAIPAYNELRIEAQYCRVGSESEWDPGWMCLIGGSRSGPNQRHALSVKIQSPETVS